MFYESKLSKHKKEQKMAFEPKISKSKIFNDVYIFQPSVGRDHRGAIFSTYDEKIYDEYLGSNSKFTHDKFSESKHNVLRGLHGDQKTWKLVTCVYGEIYQVAVDMRPDSPNYLKWDSWVINAKNKIQVLIPPNFVNGHYVLSDYAVFHYKLAYKGDYIDANEQKVVRWDDDRLNIPWPCNNPVLQDRDK